MIVMCGVLAFAVDLGYVHVVGTQLQRSADAAAMAGAGKLFDEMAKGNTNFAAISEYTTTEAAEYAALNMVSREAPSLAVEDVVVGHLNDLSILKYLTSDDDPPNLNELTSFEDSGPYKVVYVRVRRTVPMFFARVIGTESCAQKKYAIAVFFDNFAGFRTPSSGENLKEILPFALDKETWDELLVGNATDNWTWNEELEQIEAGSDGVLEVNLFPQGTGSPGNRGTVDIGNTNNSTADIRRQILEGISPEDLSHHGGELALDENGELSLNGDTGISAGVESALEEIRIEDNKPRVVPLFTQVTGPGNNAQYTIVGFVGIRIMEVKLTGNMQNKRVVVQPAKVTIISGGIPGTGSPTSYNIYSPVWLVR